MGCRAGFAPIVCFKDRFSNPRIWSRAVVLAGIGLSVARCLADYQLTNPGTGTPPHAVSGGNYSLKAKVSAPSAESQSGSGFSMTGSGPIAVSDQVAVVPGAATLFIARDGSSLTLSWLDTGVVLETATSADAAAVWQAVSPTPASQSYVVSTKDPVRFYRLRRP